MSNPEQVPEKSLIAGTARHIRQYTDFLFDMTPYGVTEREHKVHDVQYGAGLILKSKAVAQSTNGLLTFVERRLATYESGLNSYWYEFTLGSLLEECRRRNLLVKSSVAYIMKGQVPQVVEETVKKSNAKVFRGKTFDNNPAQHSQLLRLDRRMSDSALLDEEAAEREREMVDLSNAYVLEEMLAAKGLLARICRFGR